MLFFSHRRPLELDTDGIWCVLPASFPENFQVHLRNIWGMEKNCKNAFKCIFFSRSVTMHLPSSSLHLSCDSMSCGVSFVQHYLVIRFFFQLVSPPKLLSLCLSSLIFFSVMGACFTSPFCGVSWQGCSIVTAMGVLFKLGAGCQKVKPLNSPGTQPTTGNTVAKCNNY